MRRRGGGSTEATFVGRAGAAAAGARVGIAMPPGLSSLLIWMGVATGAAFGAATFGASTGAGAGAALGSAACLCSTGRGRGGGGGGGLRGGGLSFFLVSVT